MSFSTPAEIVAQAERAALNKILSSFPRTLVAAMLAGIYIAMGGLLSLLIGYGFPEWTAGNPGLQKLLSGCMFPLGLILVVLAGAELRNHAHIEKLDDRLYRQFYRSDFLCLYNGMVYGHR